MVAGLYATFKTNKEMEQGHGITLSFDDVKVHVRRAGGSNIKYTETLRKLSQPVRRQIQNDTLSTEAFSTLLMKTYVRSVVLGWENVTDEDGNALEYTEENFIKVMTDLPDFWNAVVEECTRLANFRAANTELDGEDLGNSSSGTPNGETT